MAAKKENWVGKLKRKAHELLKGENAYISPKRQREMAKLRRQKKGTKPAKEYVSARHKTITSGLKKAGINWEKDKPSARFSKKGK